MSSIMGEDVVSEAILFSYFDIIHSLLTHFQAHISFWNQKPAMGSELSLSNI